MEKKHKSSTEFRQKIENTKSPSDFNGSPEEEILKQTLPDLLIPDLDIVIIGINPGLTSALKGHHYAGPTNHFWRCLNLSGLTPKIMTANDDFELLRFGIGFTNVVERTTKSSVDLKRHEIKKGCNILLEKIKRFTPKIAVFNGKFIYEVFSGNKDFSYGVQPEYIQGTQTYTWVMPSSSARSACLPSPSHKLPFYKALKKFRDILNGSSLIINKEEFIFPVKEKGLTLKDIKGVVKSEYFDEQNTLKDNECLTSRKRHVKDEGEMETNLKVLRLICNRRK